MVRDALREWTKWCFGVFVVSLIVAYFGPDGHPSIGSMMLVLIIPVWVLGSAALLVSLLFRRRSRS